MKTQNPHDRAQTREAPIAQRPKGEQAIGTDLYEQIRAALRELTLAGR